MSSLFLHLVKIKEKSQIHYVFINIVSLMILWNVSSIFEKWFYSKGLDSTAFLFINYLSICFVPVSILLLGIIFTNNRINFFNKYILLFIVPIISYILLLTTNYHHLFFVNYSISNRNIVYGSYFIIHAIYSYTCIFIGIIFLIYSSVKNSGFFSKQVMVILTGFSLPLITNILYTLKILQSDQEITAITFSFSTICFYIAIFKYDFLKVMPIALQKVVDRISNGFIVIDMDLRIVNFNKTMTDLFGHSVNLNKKEIIFKICENILSVDIDTFQKYVEEVHKTSKSLAFEKQIIIKGSLERFFTIEITPIVHKNKPLGTLIMFTDITQLKNDLLTIKKQQEQITEKERLASLGTLMGGISHNLKTPIMSITGCITALEELSTEYAESIGNPQVENNDHISIADEMQMSINDLKDHMSYISNALTAIKNQVVNPDARTDTNFSLSELITNIDFLMKYEVKANKCHMDIINEAGDDCLINGDVGTLVQILNNLISNSIQSYEKNSDTNIPEANNIGLHNRKITLHISHEDGHIVFMVRDYGKGISQEIKEKLFREMVTSKGKEGHGIGLYLSYSKVKLMFKGDMWLQSEEGKGTSFYVKILPALEYARI